jgi:cyclic dehypoxanthinyl futalosine synthase
MTALLEAPQTNELHSSIDDIADKVYAGERLSYEDGLRLMHHPNLHELGMLADFVRQRQNPGNVVTYIAGRNINYTNVCWVQCKFCAFYRLPGKDGAYTLSKEEIFQKTQEMVDLGGIEILLQGGLNPKLRIEYYEDLFSSITQKFPTVWLHALSVAEILYIAKISRISLEESLLRLRNAGLKTIPGAGAEMLVDRVRNVIAPYKDTAEEWLETMKLWHRLGGYSTVTMMYGTVETTEERLEHILRTRDAQDESLKNGGGSFTAFIAWNFQPDGTPLGDELTGGADKLVQIAGLEMSQPEQSRWKKATGFDYLRTIAVAR